MDLVEHLRTNPFLLAPMAAITDCPFRTLMREMGCGIVITELVSATGLKFNSERTKNLMKFEEVQRPIGIQIFGDSLEDLAFAARCVEEQGADFVDLNFGCPVPKVVKKGGGAAILKDLNRVEQVFKTVREATNLPVTVKIRTGWDDSSRNAAELTNIAYNEGLTWVAIHGRTRAQAYKGCADWEFIADVKSKSKLPIIGNGDITSAEIAVRRLKESGCDGVMIGRGCLKNPWIFKEANELLAEGKYHPTQKMFDQLIVKLTRHMESHREERIQMLQLKKLSSWYSTGYPNASSFRKEIFQIKEKPELLDRINTYFASVGHLAQKDTSSEDFLMGGHG